SSQRPWARPACAWGSRCRPRWCRRRPRLRPPAPRPRCEEGLCCPTPRSVGLGTRLGHGVSVTTTSTQNLFKTTVATGTSASQQAAVISGGQSQGSAQPQGQPRLPLPPHTAAQVPAQPLVIPSSPVPGTTVVSQEMQENVKKCKNFLATLIKLASHNSPSPETSRNVKALVQDLLDAKIDPEEFTGRLQTELKSSPQPYLVPFLKKSLPALRQSLLNSQHLVLQGQPSQQSLQQSKLSQVIPQSASGSISSVTTQTIGIRQPNNICTVSVSNTVQPPQVKVVQSNQSSQLQIIQSTSAQTVKRTPACQTTQIRMPVVITQTIRPQGTVGKAPTIQASKSPGGFGVQVSANQKNKLNDPGGGSFRDDDDINDVASMAGVNLNEESARIMATNSDLVGTQMQSCKDEPFLAAIPLHKRILETGEKHILSFWECVLQSDEVLRNRICLALKMFFLSIWLHNFVFLSFQGFCDKSNLPQVGNKIACWYF
ncbi:hypothetical protein Nmel_012401, partial [Mimus melanotis]